MDETEELPEMKEGGIVIRIEQIQLPYICECMWNESLRNMLGETEMWREENI